MNFDTFKLGKGPTVLWQASPVVQWLAHSPHCVIIQLIWVVDWNLPCFAISRDRQQTTSVIHEGSIYQNETLVLWLGFPDDQLCGFSQRCSAYFSVLLFALYVLHFAFYVSACSAFCVLCFVFYRLHFTFCILHFMFCIFCVLHFLCVFSVLVQAIINSYVSFFLFFSFCVLCL